MSRSNPNNDSDADEHIMSGGGEYYETRYSDGRRAYTVAPAASVLISSAFSSTMPSNPNNNNNMNYTFGNNGNNGNNNYIASTIISPNQPITNSYSAKAHADAILSRIQNAQAPIEVHETDSISVMVDGVLIRGIWVNKEDSVQWRSDNPNDKRNALSIGGDLQVSSVSAEIIKKTYVQSSDMVQNINIKFLKPPPPCVGDLIIEQMPDVYQKPLPPIWIRERQDVAARMPDQVYREKPRILDCVPDAIVKVDGKVHPAPPRQIIVERMPKLEAKPGDIYVERWLGIPKLKRLVKYKKHKTEPIVQVGKDVIIDWKTTVNLRAQQKFNYLGIEAPVDPERYILDAQTRGIRLDEQSKVREWPDFTNYYNGQVRTQGEILLIDQDRVKPSEYELTFENDQTRQQYELLSRSRRNEFKEFLEWSVKYKTSS